MQRFKHMVLFMLFIGCASKSNHNMTPEFTNDLINETSPYLLQHAHNPVQWKPWSDSALNEVKNNNKLLLISIGYAACHWCHVMEYESFEDTLVAQVMNSNYVNIKVDREERPDVDQVYMNAVQLMTGQGGWPLNIVALPNGKPVWGGTYFKKQQWISALNQIAELYENNPEKLYEYANKLEQGIKAMDVVQFNNNKPQFKPDFIESAVKNWQKSFDKHYGGYTRAPKFMMPNNYHFLLRYAYQNNHPELLDYVNLTLTKMAHGGIFDQLGGGFSRYSVDVKWHVPHFEKMLYDNAQLVSLYADAYLLTKKDLYKEIIQETLNFVNTALTAQNGAFYSSLDADSLNDQGKLEEGAFYVWTKNELQTILKDDYNLFSKYYNINDYGYWEHNNYVLIKKDDDAVFSEQNNITLEVLNTKKDSWKTTLLNVRNKRSQPRLDDKTLTSWNALMLKAYVDAYRVLGEKTYLASAEKNAHFIINNQLQEDGGLFHNYKNGNSSINGFLEDYATTVDAFITLYEATGQENWLHTARDLTNYTFDHFYDTSSKMFFFTSSKDAALVSRSIEYRDNVIAASNSIMAKNLFKLSHYFNNTHFLNTATSMLNNVTTEMQDYPSGYSNWFDLMLNYTNPFYEVAISGTNATEKLKAFNQTYIPNKLIAISEEKSNLSLLQNRFNNENTLIYVCVNNSCKLPVTQVNDALKLIEK